MHASAMVASSEVAAIVKSTRGNTPPTAGATRVASTAASESVPAASTNAEATSMTGEATIPSATTGGVAMTTLAPTR